MNTVTGCTPASFEPAMDYVVVKVPRWPFDKFKTADRTLTTAMKSTGEVMAIGRTVEEGFKKALRSLDTDITRHTNPNEIRMILSRPTDERFGCLFDAFREGFTVEEVAAAHLHRPLLPGEGEEHRGDGAAARRKGAARTSSERPRSSASPTPRS